MIAKVTQRTESGPSRASPTARHTRVERGMRLSPTQYAQLCMDCRRRSSSCCHPKLVPLFNESGKLVPTSRPWGHQRKARLRSGFCSARGLSNLSKVSAEHVLELNGPRLHGIHGPNDAHLAFGNNGVEHVASLPDLLDYMLHILLGDALNELVAG